MDDSDWFTCSDTDFGAEAYRDSENPIHLKWFGLWQVTVSKAAEIIAVGQWFKGNFRKCKVPDKESYAYDDPDLLKALAQPIKDFRKRLIESIAAGQLKTQRIRRDFESNILPDKSGID